MSHVLVLQNFIQEDTDQLVQYSKAFSTFVAEVLCSCCHKTLGGHTLKIIKPSASHYYHIIFGSIKYMFVHLYACVMSYIYLDLDVET